MYLLILTQSIILVTLQIDEENIFIDLGSDQTSLHNPWAGGYYPAGLSFEESNDLMANKPEVFKQKVKESLIRHSKAINKHTAKGTYFFDYGNAFLLEASTVSTFDSGIFEHWFLNSLNISLVSIYSHLSSINSQPLPSQLSLPVRNNGGNS